MEAVASAGEWVVSKFRVSGQPTLLTALVAALVRERHGPDAAVIDAPGPLEHEGVRVTEAVHGRWLFVGPGSGRDAFTVAALSEGASGVLHLGSSLEEFDLALDTLVTGERSFVPVDLVRWMAGEALARRDGSRNGLAVTLTHREREILQLVARGYTNHEIADELTISQNTVRSHLHALSVKLDANNRTRMLANARALAIPEALEFGYGPRLPGERVPA